MVSVEEFKNYISPKEMWLSFDFAQRNNKNMHKPTLNLDEDIQWLFSPVHIREVFRECVDIFKHEKEILR